MADPEITVAPDAPPTALALAATLRRAAADRKLAGTLSKLRGRIAMRSAGDAQAATVCFERGRIEVGGGVDPRCDVVVTADFESLGQPDAPKPKVKGALRRPLFALRSAKVLEPKVAGGWRGAVEDFWRRAQGRPGLPDPLVVVCTDDGSELRLGGDGPAALEAHGTADALVAVFTSSLHPGEAWFRGRLRLLTDQRTMQLFCGVAGDLMMGG